MSTHSNWPAYVAALGSTAEVAQAASVNFSTSARWRSGANPPSPGKVIDLARAMHQSPVDALVAAGYLTQEDVNKAGEAVPRPYALRDFTDLELAREAVRRIESGSNSDLLEQPLDGTHPAMTDELTHRRRTVGDLTDDDLAALPTAAGTDETQPDEE